MDVLDCIRTRRSVRKYKDKTVAMDLIGQVLEAGRMAPTAGNLQNYKIIMVKDKARRDSVADACHEQHWMNKAPVLLVVCSEPQRAKQFYYERGETVYSIQNCATITENMMIAAWGLGLGTCWVGSFDVDGMRDALVIPEYAEPQVVVTLGYADEKPETPDRYKLWDMVFVNKWEARIANLGFATREISPTVEKKFKEGKDKLKGHAERLLGRVRDKTLDLKKTVHKKVKGRKKGK